ncbi:hypothetical protein Ddye_015070 [Dipteronia dyeriana]|uniref:DUF4283 domain-containing protein n=1 Tax=Dipteronia dyeriana TaxID=168575 RepID=A0AAD9WY55_9ROSI|nr:hypothetical protein Ddye_015070 [Dipteronia dyeriana]
MIFDSNKNLESCSAVKRARSDSVVIGSNNVAGDSTRSDTVGSFKSKLMSMANPNSWFDLGVNKEKLKIDSDDILMSDGPNGPMTMMKLSSKLKHQLHKPWVNALILKNMGRAHTLSFIITKLTQKWNLIGQWQLTDHGEGYFVARFQMKDDLDHVLTNGPWVIANCYLVV